MWYKKANKTVWIVENNQAVEKTLDEIEELIGKGTLTRESLAWQSGMANWQEAIFVPDLLRFFYQNKAPGIAPQQTAPTKPRTHEKTVVESDFAKNFQVGDRVVFGNFVIPNPKNWEALEFLLYRSNLIIEEMFTVEMSDSYDYKGKVLRWNSYNKRTTKIDEISEYSRTQYVILPKLDFVKQGSEIWYYFGAGTTYPCVITKVDGTLDLIDQTTMRGFSGDINSCLFKQSGR